MHGVAATVLMDGSADIANETANLHVVVIPEVNLGTAPLVYALAVNPVIGLGSFLAQLFLSAPVMKALTYHMQVTGPWKAPVVTKLDAAKETFRPKDSHAHRRRRTNDFLAVRAGQPRHRAPPGHAGRRTAPSWCCCPSTGPSWA
jgi:hypothetical protein